MFSLYIVRHDKLLHPAGTHSIYMNSNVNCQAQIVFASLLINAHHPSTAKTKSDKAGSLDLLIQKYKLIGFNLDVVDIRGVTVQVSQGWLVSQFWFKNIQTRKPLIILVVKKINRSG